MTLFKQLALAGFILTISSVCYAHGGDDQGRKTGAVKKEQKAWGIAGDARQDRWTVELAMADTMRFSRNKIDVRQGETVRIVLRNQGQILHEFVIGTKRELEEHAALMVKFPNMEHDEPYMAHVPPGNSGEIVWTFNRPGEFDFACLVAGHYQAGMVGKINVAASAAKGNGHDEHKH